MLQKRGLLNNSHYQMAQIPHSNKLVINQKWFIPFALTLLPLLVFGRVSGYGFVWDDELFHLHHNPYLQEINLTSIFYFWHNPYQGMYIPVTYSCWAFVKYFSGGFDSSIFHLLNLFVHIANGYLLFFILRKLVDNSWAACAGALLFLLHPIQVESVAWISEFRGLLGSFFSFLSLWQYLIYADAENRDKWVYYLLATLAFVLALLSKPSTVVLPLIVGMFLKSPRKARGLLLWIPLSLIITIITKSIQPDILVQDIAPWHLRPFVALDSYGFYISKILFPFELCPLYGRTPKLVLDQGYFWFSGVWVVFFLGGAGSLRNHSSWIWRLLGIFCFSLLPVSGFIPFGFQEYSTVADRYLYFGMLAPALALALFLSSVPYSKLQLFFLGFLLVGYAFLSYGQLPVWQNKVSLWQDVIMKFPEQALPHNNLGNTFKDKGFLDEARYHYGEALQIDPTFPEAHNNLANIYEEENNTSLALYHYLQALKMKPDSLIVHKNLGLFYQRQGQVKKAREHYEKTLEVNAQYGEGHFLLGNTFQLEGDSKRAIYHYQSSLKIIPFYAKAHNNLANAWVEEKNIPQAIHHYSQAIKYNPSYDTAYCNLGIILEGQGKIEEAVENYERAIQVNPQSPAVDYLKQLKEK